MSRQRLTREQRITAYHRFSGRCWYCGTTLDPFNFEIDHITPVKDGGGEEPGNLAATCPPCNGSKGCRPLAYLRAILTSPPSVSFLYEDEASRREALA